MALKKLTEAQKIRVANMNQKEEKQTMNTFSNSITGKNEFSREEVIESVENTLENVIEEHTSNYDSDSFFNSESLNGSSTSITGLEIEIEPEIAVVEGKYKFYVKNLNVDRQVATKYGVKDKLMVEFHISQVIDGEDFAYDLKQKYNISGSRKSSFYQLYIDLIGKAPIGKLNLRNLLGVKGYCEVKHIPMDNGDIFPRIININAEINKDEIPAL